MLILVRSIALALRGELLHQGAGSTAILILNLNDWLGLRRREAKFAVRTQHRDLYLPFRLAATLMTTAKYAREYIYMYMI
jgi:hypothetical protein